MNNEPVAWMFKHKKVVDFNKPDVGDDNWIPLYTHLAELTDEEIMEVAYSLKNSYEPYNINFARAILRKAQE